MQVTAQEDSLALLLEKIERAVAAGVDWIQLREKDLTGKQCSALTRKALLRVSEQSSRTPSVARIIVNGRLDAALAQQAGGIHLGEHSLRVEDAKRMLAADHLSQTLPPGLLVGVSCHSLEAARSAVSAGADYIFFGPIFPTPSKTAFGAPQGLDRLSEVCDSVTIPVLAIGGVTPENMPACLSAGASGIAAIRLFQDSPDLPTTVNALRHHL